MLTAIKLASALLATTAGVIGAEIMLTDPAAGWTIVALVAALWTYCMYQLVRSSD